MSALLRDDAEFSAAQGRLMRWRADPVAFAREALHVDVESKREGFSQDGWQADFLRSIAGNERTAAASGTGVGKSLTLGAAVVWWHTTRFPAKTLVTGSKFDQLRNTMWAEVNALIQGMDDPLRQEMVWTTERLSLKSAPEQSFAAIQTSAKQNAQNLAGWHSPNLLIIVDEASAVLEVIFETLEGNMSTAGAKMVLAGNRTQATGTFAETFKNNRTGWKTFVINGENVSRVRRSWIEQVAAKYGRDSNVYRVRVQGLPPTSDEDGVIPLEFLEAAVGRDVQPIQNVRPIWGVDVAISVTGDRAALAKRQANVQLEKVKWWRGVGDTMQLAGIIHKEWLGTPADLRPAEIIVDAIGIGRGVADKLKMDGLPAVCLNVSESRSSDGHSHRLRDSLYWKCREWLEARDCRLCEDDPELIAELATPKAAYPNGLLQVESKVDIKKRLDGASPDLSDAWIYTFAGNERSTRYQAAARRSPADDRPWSGHDPW